MNTLFNYGFRRFLHPETDQKVVTDHPFFRPYQTTGTTQREEPQVESLVSHLPSDGGDEGVCASHFDEKVSRLVEGSVNSAGEASGWPVTPPHSPVVQKTIPNARPIVLRLSVQETWKLSDSSFDFRGCELSPQGRPPTFDPWRSAGSRKRPSPGDDQAQEGFFYPQDIQSNIDSASFTLWVVPASHPEIRPRLLLAQQTKNRRVSFISYVPIGQPIQKGLANHTCLLGRFSNYKGYSRMVEVEYKRAQSFQATAALHIWAQEHLQDHHSELVETILEGVRHAKIGGLLRFLRRQPMGYCLVRGVPGAKNDPVSERIYSRLFDDSETEGQADPQDQEPSPDSSFQLHSGGMLQEEPDCGCLSIGHIEDSLFGSSSEGTVGHTRPGSSPGLDTGGSSTLSISAS